MNEAIQQGAHQAADAVAAVEHGATAVKLPPGFSATQVVTAVRDRYSEVGFHPVGQYEFRIGRAFAEALGYPCSLLDRLPAGAVEAFTGVSTPSLHSQVQAGDFVVDLGCGGGLDLILLGWMVGPRGRVVGIDFAPGMVGRARRNVGLSGLSHVAVRETPASDTGLPDSCADWVIANGILNLSPDRDAILREVTRILRPGGQFLLAEIALHQPLPENKIEGIRDWFR